MIATAAAIEDVSAFAHSAGKIPSITVTPRPDGYVIILRPGDHQKVTHQNRYFVPYDSVIPSGDDNFHICLHPTEEDENCFFAPADAI